MFEFRNVDPKYGIISVSNTGTCGIKSQSISYQCSKTGCVCVCVSVCVYDHNSELVIIMLADFAKA